MSDEILRFDFSSFQKMADKLGVARQQIPYALSRALNESVFQARGDLVSMWPTKVQAKNPSFIGWALGVKKSSKHDLSVAVTDERAQGRGRLVLHADGGTKTARSRLAIPIQARRGRHGVVRGQRPADLKNKFVKDGIIWRRYGPKNPIYILKRGKRKGKVGKLNGSWGKSADGKHVRGIQPMYTLRRSAPIRADVPFRETFKATMQREMMQRAPKAMLEAARTAIRR